MAIHETFFNRYSGWGTENKQKPEGIVIFIMRNRGHILSPTYDLLELWSDRRITWEQFETRFKKELSDQTAVSQMIERIATLAMSKNVWLVCACSNNKKQCHRYIVKEMIQKKIEDVRECEVVH